MRSYVFTMGFPSGKHNLVVDHKRLCAVIPHCYIPNVPLSRHCLDFTKTFQSGLKNPHVRATVVVPYSNNSY